jgi:hypothetical protein
MLLIVDVRTSALPVDFSVPPRRRAFGSPVVRSADYLAKSIKSMKVMLADGCCSVIGKREQGSVQPGGRRLWPVRRHRR